MDKYGFIIFKILTVKSKFISSHWVQSSPPQLFLIKTPSTISKKIFK